MKGATVALLVGGLAAAAGGGYYFLVVRKRHALPAGPMTSIDRSPAGGGTNPFPPGAVPSVFNNLASNVLGAFTSTLSRPNASPAVKKKSSGGLFGKIGSGFKAVGGLAVKANTKLISTQIDQFKKGLQYTVGQKISGFGNGVTRGAG